jgi:hypothetical protein
LSPEELMNATPVKNVSGHTYIKTPLDK